MLSTASLDITEDHNEGLCSAEGRSLALYEVKVSLKEGGRIFPEEQD